MEQQDILFPRKSSGQISRTKVSTWSGKENSAKWNEAGREEIGDLIPPAGTCLARYGHYLRPAPQRGNSDYLLPFPLCQK